MQADGNLVLYDATNRPRWATGTNGRAITHVVMQPDGNLVIYRNKTAVWASDTYNANAQGGYFEIDLATWTGRIYCADGGVAKVLFGSPAPPIQPSTATAPVAQPPPSQPVQLNIGTAPLATPTPAPQTVQMIEGPTTVISGTLAPATSYSNLGTTAAVTAALQLQSGTAPPRLAPGVKCIDFSLTGSCGSDKVDKLGSYSLNMKCDEGFYDPIWGGTCWKCPDDDGSGAFIRSANKIQDADACWRVPKEKTSSATRVKNTAWAWECPGGTFWDGYDWGAGSARMRFRGGPVIRCTQATPARRRPTRPNRRSS